MFTKNTSIAYYYTMAALKILKMHPNSRVLSHSSFLVQNATLAKCKPHDPVLYKIAIQSSPSIYHASATPQMHQRG
jgi:hypothetical protein